MPPALAAAGGPAAFYLNHDPCTSSAYPLNPDHADFTGQFYGTDYRLGDAATTRRTLSVTPRRLDPQGNEVDILEGV